MNEEERQQFEELEKGKTEENSNILRAKERVAGAAEGLARRLHHQIAMGHDKTAFFIALSLAIIKDVLDAAEDLLLLLIPVIGWILSMIARYFSFAIGAFLTIFLFNKGWFRKTKLRGIYWLLGFALDELPVWGSFPTSTLMVIISWHAVKKAAIEAEEKVRRATEEAQVEIEGLEGEEMELEEEYA